MEPPKRYDHFRRQGRSPPATIEVPEACKKLFKDAGLDIESAQTRRAVRLPGQKRQRLVID